MKYTHPDFGDNTIIFDAGRYVVVEVSSGSTFQGYDSSDGFVLFDCELTRPIALIHRSGDGIRGKIVSHVGHPDNEFATMDAAVKGCAKQHKEYLDSVMGPET